MTKPARILSIAGSTAGGSAGVQADLKTFQELDVYGMSIITAIVSRHRETNKNIHLQTIEAIEAQFTTAFAQTGVDALKTGMLFSKDIIETVAREIKQSGVKHVVVDPVMIGKMNSILLAEDAIEKLKSEILPIADVITPNMPEASYLLGGRELNNVSDLKQAAIDLHNMGLNHVLVKGGRLMGPAIDVLYDGETLTTFEAPRIDTINTSGAGCSYSAAIAAYLGKGKSMIEAIELAKQFITTAIAHSFSYTETVGPTYHAALRLKNEPHYVKVTQE